MTQDLMTPARRGLVASIYRALGFGETAIPNPWPDEVEGFAPSYLAHTVIADFDWRDRLRILVSGKVMTRLSVKTDVSVERTLSASKVAVLPPSWRPPGHAGRDA